MNCEATQACRRSKVILGGAALSVCFSLTALPAVSAAELPTIDLAIKGHRLVAEIAATETTRETGLMHRFSLQRDHGMLFVFKDAQPQAFWMKNTYVPLSIAFVGSDGRILNIDDMAPLTESTHLSRGAALYALEMKKGWFAERGIATGDPVTGLEKAPKPRE